MTVEPEYHEDPPDHDIELEGFTHFNWKSAAARDRWADLWDEMKRAKWLAEWRSVMDGSTDRKAAIVHIDNQNREKWLERVGEYGLHFRAIRHSKPYNGFSHKFLPTSPDDPERITYSVIAEDRDVADKMEEAELEMQGMERHDTVGKLLGFPECCRAFFNRVWLSEGQIDPMYEISCRSSSAEPIGGDPEEVRVQDPNPGINILWRYFGLSFITHHPCSWECSASVDIARERYRIMAENGLQSAADGLAEWLSEPCVWTGYHRIAEVRNRYATSASRSDNYWSKKRVVWKEEHVPSYEG